MILHAYTIYGHPGDMNLILLCLTSMLLGRYFEKKMPVASIAHAVMFIVMAFLFLFHSDIALVDRAMINIFGEENFYIVHDALVETAIIYRSAISSLLVMEIVVMTISAVVTVVLLIKAVKKVLSKFNYGFKVNLSKFSFDNYVPANENDSNNRNRYLILKHLRN